ncbi:uncharacterized protein DUF2530 [Nocardia bhagyanarayanae]|uniref:Uncharacterized protein DUF2530 n=1 Tax=Nocardia bhagyanarayanae TaxID=1215925 RepID=A0A543F536_9NOCA|nr:uncharacterized protein DUF2530 [Nocardia bhagyanarayanae]
MRHAGSRRYAEPVTQKVPEIPPRLTDPRPVLAVGSALWVVATLVVLAGPESWESALPVCLMGLVVGLIGSTIFLIQRRGARRGDKGAQTGLR